MSSLSPSPDQRKTTNLQDKTNSPTKPQERLVEPFNSSLIQILPTMDGQKHPNSTREYSIMEDKQSKDAMMTKLVNQNEFLRKQIKELNSKLTEHVANLAKKARSKQELPPPSENILKKQLQNAYRQIEWYKKEVQVVHENAEVVDLFERIKKLEDLIIEKDIKLEKLTNEKKVFEKAQRDQERELEEYRNAFGYEKRLNSYYDEVKCLRDKIANMNAVNRHNENNFRKQQEHLVDLTIQYRLVCDKLGVPPNVTFRTVEDLNRIMKREGRRVNESTMMDHDENINTSRGLSHRDKTPNLPRVPASKTARSQSLIKRQHNRVVSSAGLNNAGENYTNPNELLPEDEEKYKQEIQRLQMRIFMLENEKRALKVKLKDQEKNVTVIKHNISDHKRTVIKHRSLSRLNLIKNTESQRNSVNIPSDDENTSPRKLEPDHVVIEPKKGEEIINKSIREDLNETRTIKEETKVLPDSSQQPETKVIVSDIKQETFSNFPQYENQELKNLQGLSPSKKPVFVLRKVVVGRVGSRMDEFNDKEYIPNPFISKINQLVVWSDYEFIYGIQAFYSMQNTFDIEGQEHIRVEMKEKVKDVSNIEIDDDDKICCISGKYSEGITYLQIKTLKGIIKEFGTDRDFGEEFTINLGPKEELALLHGAMREIKGDEENEVITILANIGFSVVKET